MRIDFDYQEPAVSLEQLEDLIHSDTRGEDAGGRKRKKKAKDEESNETADKEQDHLPSAEKV